MQAGGLRSPIKDAEILERVANRKATMREFSRMEKRPFGKTPLQVSVLGYGAGAIGDESISEIECERLLNSIVDAGINLIDTARSYGMSEERIGRHLKKRRKDIVLSTKIGYGIPGYQDWTPAVIEAGVNQALRLLQTDYVDIVHLHSCPLETLKKDGIMDALQRAVKAGKVKVPAYSGDNEPFEWALSSGHFSGLQTSINICDQRSIPAVMQAAERGIGVIAKRSLANAPWRNVPPAAGDQAAAEYKLRWEKMALDFPVEQAAEIALRFVAYLPGVHACLVGSSNLQHIRQNIEFVKQGPLPQEIVEKIRSAFDLHGRDWKGQI
jgi:aryl-alcohol dehydrogenase-like predicted oxidoreductase